MIVDSPRYHRLFYDSSSNNIYLSFIITDFETSVSLMKVYPQFPIPQLPLPCPPFTSTPTSSTPTSHLNRHHPSFPSNSHSPPFSFPSHSPPLPLIPSHSLYPPLIPTPILHQSFILSSLNSSKSCDAIWVSTLTNSCNCTLILFSPILPFF